MKTQIEVQRHLQSRIAKRRRTIRFFESQRALAKALIPVAKGSGNLFLLDQTRDAVAEINRNLREVVADQQVDTRLYRMLIVMNNFELRVL